MNELQFIQSMLKYLDCQSKVLVDVGAHFGSFAKPFAQEGWQIHAFEPDAENRARFEAWANTFPELVINPQAVSDRPFKQAKFYKSHESTGISSLSSFTKGHFEGPAVDVVTLKDYCLVQTIQDIAVLKIDTEGHDLFVLKGFPWERIKPMIIMAEFEDRKTIPLGYQFEDMAQYVMDQGYAVLVSEWRPIVRYGIRHHWNRCFLYPGALETEEAWGNLIALRNDASHNIFWFSMSDQLSVQDQSDVRKEQAILDQKCQADEKDDQNLSPQEMVLALNLKMAEVKRILSELENYNQSVTLRG